MPQYFESIHAGHLQVNEHNAREHRAYELKTAWSVLRNCRTVSAHLERLPTAFCEHFLVIDNDDIKRH
jgi:hypothetical protein